MSDGAQALPDVFERYFARVAAPGCGQGDALILLGDQRGLSILKTEIFQRAIDQAIRSIVKWNKRWNKIEKK